MCVRSNQLFFYFSNRGVANGGGGGGGWGDHAPPPLYPFTPSPHFNFRTEQGSKISLSDIRDIVFNGCSEIIRTKNFTIFTVYATIFG